MIFNGTRLGIDGANSRRQREGEWVHTNRPMAATMASVCASFICGVMNQPNPFQTPGPLRRMAGRFFNGGAVLTAAVAISLAVVIGIQLGGIPWRFRRQMWQLQGALMGAALGLLWVALVQPSQRT